MSTAIDVGPTTLKTVGKQVRKHRRLAGMTQSVLAERCGIYRTYLSRIEQGGANPTLSVLIAIATNLEIDVRELVYEPVPPPR